MEKVLDNEFAFLSLWIGLCLIVMGIYYKAFPPKKLRWYNSLPLSSAWQYNEMVQREAMRWTAKPALLLGILFTGLAFLSLSFPSAPIFTFRSSALILTIVCCMIGNFLRNKHLKRLFDENGHLRGNA